MKYAYAALVSLAVAAGSVAVFTPRDHTAVPCAGAKALSSSSIAVGSDTVELTTFSCDAVPSAHVASPVAAASDACPDTTCTNVCGSSGSLPPTSDDCQTIFNAIQIFSGSISTFTVPSNRAETLSFGTCRVFLQNFSPSAPLTFCWSDLEAVAVNAAKACFPPVQPVMSEGLCEGPDGLWRVGIAHS